MKKLPLFFIIPFIAILVVVSIAFAIRLSTSKTTPPAKASEFPNSYTKTSESKPSTFLGGLIGDTPKPTPATATDLSTELKNTYDDGDQSELDAISEDADSL